MKGVILAGGLGSRLMPCTKVTNKHLLPVYNKPMIYYPLNTLVKAGIRDIIIVTGGNNAGDFLRLLGNGSEFGLKDISYTYQEGEGGIADALKLAENFVDEEKTFMEFLDQVKKNAIEAFDNQDYQFDELVEKLKVKRHSSRNPLFDVVFLMENSASQSVAVPKIKIADLEMKPYGKSSQVSKYDLLFYLYEGNNILMQFQYCEKLFKRETINLLIEYILKI